jgi:hypothetical protein
MGTTVLTYFVGEQGGVNAAEHDESPSCSGGLSDVIPAEGIPGVDADSDNVARLNGAFVNRLQRFIDQQRCPVARRRGRGKHVLPPRRNDRGSKRHVARVDEVNAHGGL